MGYLGRGGLVMPRKPRDPSLRLNDAQRALVAGHPGYAVTLSGIFRLELPRDERVSAAFWGLVLASLAYDRHKCPTFRYYARKWIRGAIMDIHVDHADGCPDGEILPDLSLDALDLAHWLIDQCPERARKICRSVWVEGITQEEAAARYNLDPARVSTWLTISRGVVSRSLRSLERHASRHDIAAVHRWDQVRNLHNPVVRRPGLDAALAVVHRATAASGRLDPDSGDSDPGA